MGHLQTSQHGLPQADIPYRVWKFPEESHSKIEYPIALLANAKPEARRFLDFILSPRLRLALKLKIFDLRGEKIREVRNDRSIPLADLSTDCYCRWGGVERGRAPGFVPRPIAN
jgi:hypothetical protein